MVPGYPETSLCLCASVVHFWFFGTQSRKHREESEICHGRIGADREPDVLRPIASPPEPELPFGN